MKRKISLFITLILLLTIVMPTGIAAEKPMSEFSIRMTAKINDFFAGAKEQYQFFDEDMQDVTESFYQRNIAFYNNQQMETILADIQMNIKRIEKITLCSIQTRAPGDITINVEREFSEMLNLLNAHGDSQYRVWMDGTMLASYVTNHNFGMIMSATKPTLSPDVYFYNHAPDMGWMATITDKISYNPVFGNDHQTVTFKLALIVKVRANESSHYLGTFPTLTIQGTYGY